MLRNILAVLAGALTNVVVVSTAEWLNLQVFPLPPGAAADPAKLDALLQKAPEMIFVGVLVGALFAALLSGLVAAKIATQPRRIALVVGILLVAANVANAYAFYHPLWFRIAAIALPLPLALLGGRIGEGRTGLNG